MTAYSYNEALIAVREIHYKGLWFRVGPISGKIMGELQQDDSVNIYNRSHYVYSDSLIQYLFEVCKNEPLKDAAIKAGIIGNEFALLVKEVQRVIYHTSDPKTVTGMLTPDDVKLMLAFRRSQYYQNLGVSPGAIGVVEMVSKHQDIYYAYYSYTDSIAKGHEPLKNLDKILSVLNSKEYTNPSTKEQWSIEEFENWFRTGAERDSKKEKDPNRVLLSNASNFALFRFAYFLVRSPYANAVSGKFNTSEDFYKAKVIYEDHVKITKDTYSKAYKKFVDDTINKNEILLKNEMERYGFKYENGAMNKGNDLQSLKKELAPAIPIVEKIKEYQRSIDNYKPTYQGPMGGGGNLVSSAPDYLYNEKKAEEENLKKIITPLQLTFPILKSDELNPERYDGLLKLEQLVLDSSSDYSLVNNLFGYYETRQKQIDKLRTKLTDNQGRYWKLEQAVTSFNQQFNIAGNETTDYLMRHVQDEESKELNTLWLSIVGMGLGAISFLIPPSSVVTIPAMISIGIYDVSAEYDKYEFDISAQGGTYDKDLALSMVEPTMAYVALSVLGLIADVTEIGIFLKTTARSVKLFNTTSKAVSKEALEEFTGLVNKYADDLVAQKKLLPENKKAFVDKLTNESVLNQNYKRFINAKKAGMKMDNFIQQYGVPESNALKQAEMNPNTLGSQDIHSAKAIAELDKEIQELNSKFKEIWNKKYDNLVKQEAGVLYSAPLITPQMVNDFYKTGRKIFDLLSTGGQLAYAKFRSYIVKHLSGLDLTDPKMEALIQKMYKDLAEGKTDVDAEKILKELEDEFNKITLDFLSQFKKIDLNLNMPIEFGGDLMKRDGVDLYVLGRTKGAKITGDNGHYAGTLNIEEIEGVNVIRQGIPSHIRTKFPNSFADQTKAYWEEINKPFLDKAINTGADIRFIQDPRLESNSTQLLSDAQKRLAIFKNMTSHKTYLFYEYNYLLEKGYILLENGLMIKNL